MPTVHRGKWNTTRRTVLRITLTYNERRSDDVKEGELLTREEINGIADAIKSNDHEVTLLEASGPPDGFVDDLLASRPELIFNVAEGTEGEGREAKYAAIFETLGLPYTGGRSSLLHVCLDKRLTEKILEARDIRVPKGCLVTPDANEIPEDIPFPILVKPNYEGSSKGIQENSIIEDRGKAQERIDRLLTDFPEGINVEQFIAGREFTVPLLEVFPSRFLEIVEHIIGCSEHNIYDYDTKHAEDEEALGVQVVCPPEITDELRKDILTMAARVQDVLPCVDMGRIDFRVDEDGTPYFLEVNAIPSLLPQDSMALAAEARGLTYEKVFDLIIRSAARRYGLRHVPRSIFFVERKGSRPTARERNVSVGRLPTGLHNAITDVEGVLVGHVTHVEDDVDVPDSEGEKGVVRTGTTAICPQRETLFHEHMVAGAFVLNGIGELAGITQAQEWGWLETPILLTNTMSVGRVHDGIIRHLVRRYPELGREVEVTIPIVGETNDAFLNDVRISANSPEDAMTAIENARGGSVEQGSVGAGAGLQTFDFAGGIGSSSRVIPADAESAQGYTVGVLVQSNFGKMRNLTIDGMVVGRELDLMFPQEGRRDQEYGSVIVVVATNAPLMTPQLNRLAKRAALGLGRVGSFAAATSGEIIIAFSTGNQVSRETKKESRLLNLDYLSDQRIDPLYEAVVEATEESVLNAIFCSSGQTGRLDRYAPPIPVEKVLELMDHPPAGD